MHDPFLQWRQREPAEQWRAAAMVTPGPQGKPAVRIDLLRLCVAWAAIPVRFEVTHPALPFPETDALCWLWCWYYCSVSDEVPETLAALCDATGETPDVTARLLRIARDNRLIYPDGTIHSCVEQVAHKAAGALFDPGDA